MAFIETIKIPAHPNIYNGHNDRELRIDFAIPEKGTDNETGLFILVPGFGAHIDSKVYKKMRNHFANQYNVVTIQCDYFGSQFMQSADNVNIPSEFDSFEGVFTTEDLNLVKQDVTKFLEVLSKYPIRFSTATILGENENEFVDMGYMQAIDIITAIEAVKIILRENNFTFNENRVIGFGQSQGAYLLHLSNVLSPHLFSLIIDNSAWVKPVYLYTNRKYILPLNKATLYIEFDYMAKKIIKDKGSLSLHELYKNFKNGSHIYSCIGTTDNLVDVHEKKQSLCKLNYVQFEVIDQEKVEGVIFKSTNHGLDSHFLKFVDYVLSIVPSHVNENKKLIKYDIVTSKTHITVDYSNGLPIFQYSVLT